MINKIEFFTRGRKSIYRVKIEFCPLIFEFCTNYQIFSWKIFVINGISYHISLRLIDCKMFEKTQKIGVVVKAFSPVYNNIFLLFCCYITTHQQQRIFSGRLIYTESYSRFTVNDSRSSPI